VDYATRISKSQERAVRDGQKVSVQDENAETVALSPDQAHKLIGGSSVISRASFYAGINRGEIPALRVGRRLLIPKHAFLRWLQSAGQTARAN
jgi:excisionase family DNA binding protein